MKMKYSSEKEGLSQVELTWEEVQWEGINNLKAISKSTNKADTLLRAVWAAKLRDQKYKRQSRPLWGMQRPLELLRKFSTNQNAPLSSFGIAEALESLRFLQELPWF